MNRSSSPALSLLAVLALAGTSSAQTLFVDGDLATGANDGSSWADALQGSAGLRTALDLALPGEEIWITGGTYYPTDGTDRTISFEITTDDLTVRGGFAGTEVTPLERPKDGTNLTILSGDLARNDNDSGIPALLSDNSFTLICGSGSERLVLEDVHVRSAGVSPSSSANTCSPRSSAAFNGSPELTLRRCSFEGGGGRGVSLLFNRSSGTAQAMRPRVEDCAFRGNRSHGVFCDSAGPIVFSRCIAEGNDGNGFFFSFEWSSQTELIDTVVVGNGAAGVFFGSPDLPGNPVLLRNCTLAGNGGLGVAQFANSLAGPGEPITLQDSIVWGNNLAGGAGSLEVVGNVIVRSCLVEGGRSAIEDTYLSQVIPPIIDADPAFVDLAAGDVSLLSSSPAIDRASNVGVGAQELDFARRHRSVDIAGVGETGLATDMGALERTGSVGQNDGCSPTPNSSGQVGRMFARGSTDLSVGSLALVADQVPVNSFGIFLTSRERAFLLSPGGSAGNLCLGGDIGRFVGSDEIQLSGSNGIVALGLNLSALPQPNGFVSVQPGDTWHFQYWHRDASASGFPTSNLSGLITVCFE